MADYSIWVVEYARVVEFAKGLLLYGQFNAGTTVAPYCYAVVKGEGHTAVIDTGYNHAEFGKELDGPLSRFGNALFDLARLFGDMHVEGQPFAIGVHAELANPSCDELGVL